VSSVCSVFSVVSVVSVFSVASPDTAQQTFSTVRAPLRCRLNL